MISLLALTLSVLPIHASQRYRMELAGVPIGYARAAREGRAGKGVRTTQGKPGGGGGAGGAGGAQSHARLASRRGEPAAPAGPLRGGPQGRAPRRRPAAVWHRGDGACRRRRGAASLLRG